LTHFFSKKWAAGGTMLPLAARGFFEKSPLDPKKLLF
jgi:hypothetical protein